MGEIAKYNAAELMKPQTTEDFRQLGTILAQSGFFSDSREAAQAAVKVMAGAELGLPPIASMTGIHLVKGKIALGGNLIAVCIRKHGYNYKVAQLDDSGCTVHFFGKNGEMLGDSSFNEADAKAAGLLSNDTYKKFPRNMYFNRAISNGAKWYTPEVFGGAPVYTPEELGATVDGDGEPIQPKETRDQVLQRRLAEEREKAEAAKRQRAIEEGTPAPPIAAHEITDDDLPEELHDPAAIQPTKRSGSKPKWAGHYEAMKQFGEMKKRLGDARYYGFLKLYGVGHCDEFSSRDTAMKCWKDMYNATGVDDGTAEVVEEPIEA